MTLRGRVERQDRALVRQLVADLVINQGNRAVTVDTQELETADDISFDSVADAARARGATFTVRTGREHGRP